MGVSKRGNHHLRSLLVHGARAVVRTAPDPPPLNWSTLRYVFGHEKEDRNAEKAPQA